MRVLVVPEDSRKDKFILKPLFKALFSINRQAKDISARRIESAGRRQKATRRGGGAADNRHPAEVS